MSEFRIEHDSMGEVRVPVDARWRAQTQRAVENFPISGRRLEPSHIAALGLIKAVAAEVNTELGVLDKDVAEAIAQAAADVAENEYDEHFPIDVFQTGSGTSSNMNVNEVIATLAQERLGRPVHPNDHVNASQSSNDVFPTSIHVAAATEVVFHLVPSLQHLAIALRAKSTEFAQTVKSGRTHLMDATPVTLGQEFGGYASQIEHGVSRVNSALRHVVELPLGGTAVGTGINTPPASPRRPSRSSARRRASGSSRPRTTSRRRAPRTRSSSCPGSSRSSPSRSTRSQTTCAGWARVPGRGSARSTCPTSSPARRSCRARSTR